MNNFDKDIFDILAGKAVLHAEHRWARLCAAVVHKNKIISIGFNKNKSHPFQAKYSKNDQSIYLHAETDAIRDSLRKVDAAFLGSCDLYVCRIKHDAKQKNKLVYGLAKPCLGCAKCIVTFDIKNVYYTTDEGTIEQL